MDRSQFYPSFGVQLYQELSGPTFADADVESPEAVQKNILKYANELSVPSDEFVRMIPQIQTILKAMLGDGLVIDELTLADFEEFGPEELSDSYHGSPGLIWEKTYTCKRDIIVHLGLETLYWCCVRGAFLIPFVDKSCNKTEFRAIENGQVKVARGFTPCQFHDFLLSTLLFSRSLHRLENRHWFKVGMDIYGLGYDKLFNDLRTAQIKLDLPDKYACADIGGNDKRQRAWQRAVFAGCYQVPAWLMSLFLHCLRQIDESFIVDQNGFTFYRKDGLSSGKKKTLHWNTLVGMVNMIWLLLLKGENLFRVMEWAAALFGDDVLVCWPYDDSYCKFYNEKITPLTGLTATNENPLIEGETEQRDTIPLESCQFLSFQFRRVGNRVYPRTIQPNKCLARLNASTENESRKEVIKQFILLHYYSEDLLPILKDLFLVEVPNGEIELAKCLSQAHALHNALQ